MSTTASETWLTRVEAASFARYSLSTIDRAVRRGELPKAKNDVKRVRIAMSDLMRFMKGLPKLEK